MQTAKFNFALITVLLGVGILSVATHALAQASGAGTMVLGNRNLLANGNFASGATGWTLQSKDAQQFKLTAQVVGGAMRLTCNRPAQLDSRDGSLAQSIGSEFRSGDRVRVQMTVRGNGEIGFGLLDSTKNALGSGKYRLTDKPQTVAFDVNINQNFPAQNLAFNVWFESLAGWVEVSDARVVKTFEAPLPVVPVKVAPVIENIVFNKESGFNLISNGDFTAQDQNWECWGEFVDAKFDSNALQMKVAPGAQDKATDAGMIQILPKALRRGQNLTLRFKAKGSARFQVLLQEPNEPWHNFFDKTLTPSRDGQEYVFTVVADRDYPEGGAALRFHFGFETGEVQFSDIQVLVAR